MLENVACNAPGLQQLPGARSERVPDNCSDGKGAPSIGLSPWVTGMLLSLRELAVSAMSCLQGVRSSGNSPTVLPKQRLWWLAQTKLTAGLKVALAVPCELRIKWLHSASTASS